MADFTASVTVMIAFGYVVLRTLDAWVLRGFGSKVNINDANNFSLVSQSSTLILFPFIILFKSPVSISSRSSRFR